MFTAEGPGSIPEEFLFKKQNKYPIVYHFITGQLGVHGMGSGVPVFHLHLHGVGRLYSCTRNGRYIKHIVLVCIP